MIGLLDLRLKHGITIDVEQVTHHEPRRPARKGMKNIRMENRLIHAIMEFYYIIRVVGKCTTVVDDAIRCVMANRESAHKPDSIGSDRSMM